MKKKLLLGVVCLGILAFLVGCAGLGLKAYSQMMLEEKSLFLLKQYNKVWDNTFSQTLDPSLTAIQKDEIKAKVLAGVMTIAEVPINPNLTPEQRKIINAKKDGLARLYPLVVAFKTVVDGGGTPSAETEQKILDLIDQLTALGMGV